MLIRPEEEKDFEGVENLVREAFWDVYKPGCDEHLIVHNIRKVKAFVPELDFVAVGEGGVVGAIIYSKAKVINAAGEEFEVLCMGPLAVSPSYQKKGIGAALMQHSIDAARELGWKGIVIFGDPGYYRRFGFKSAAVYGIQTAEGANFDAFMAMELSPGSLGGISGKFHYDPVFTVGAKELEEFEKKFPRKEKHSLPTQLNQSVGGPDA